MFSEHGYMYILCPVYKGWQCHFSFMCVYILLSVILSLRTAPSMSTNSTSVLRRFALQHRIGLLQCSCLQLCGNGAQIVAASGTSRLSDLEAQNRPRVRRNSLSLSSKSISCPGKHNRSSGKWVGCGLFIT